MPTRPTPEEPWLDWLAIGTSLLCLVHCLALPLIIASLPSLGTTAGGVFGKADLTHWLLLAMAVPVSLWALGRGRAGPLPLITGAVGLALMALAVLRFEGTPDERWLTVAGVILVAIAHLMRWRSLHRGHGHGAGR